MQTINILRWLRWSKEPDYEEELPRLSRLIAEARVRLLTASSRHRRWPFLFLVQAIAIYVTYVATAVRMSLHLHPRHMVALALTPVSIYAVYRAISQLTAWRKGQVDAQLKLLTAKRKSLVEDYKKKTNFDKIQRLIQEEEEDSSSAPTQNFAKSNVKTGKQQSSTGNVGHGTVSSSTPSSSSAINHLDFERKQTANGVTNQLSRPSTELATAGAAVEPVPVYHTSWVDRVLDLLLGENELGPDSRFALICSKCHAHNGLAPGGKLAEEIIYKCRVCGFENNNQSVKANEATTEPQPTTDDHKATKIKSESSSEAEQLK